MKTWWVSGVCLFLLLAARPTMAAFTSGSDLGVTVTPETNQVTQGNLAIFTLVLTNAGPSNVLSAITVTNTLSAGLEFFNTDGGTYNASNGVWTVSSLAAMSSARISVYADTLGTGVQSDSAQVGIPLGYTDSNAANNFATTNITVNAPIRTQFGISGSVLGCATNGAGFGLVNLYLSGGTNWSTRADNNGAYAFTNLAPGNYTVTPARTGITFTPPNLMVTLGSNDLTLAPFVASGAGGVIQGRLTYGSGPFPVSDIPVVLFGTPDRTVITDSSGYYIFTNCAPGFYTVAPTPKFGFKPVPSGMTVSLSESNCSTVANFTAQFRMVELVALEVTQVIQDWDNSVPLISAKRTYLRAHLQLASGSNTTSARLTGARVVNPQFPNAPLPPVNFAGQLTVYTTNAASVRGDWDASLNFELPAAWCTGALTLQFSCTNNVTIVPVNVVPPDQTVSVVFTPANVLPLKFFAWNTGGGQVNAEAYADLPGRLVSLYPVPDITMNQAILTPSAALALPAIPTNASEVIKTDWALLNSNSKLGVLQAIDFLLGGRFGGGTNWIYYGALPEPAPGSQGWARSTLTSSNTINKEGSSPLIASGYVSPKFYTLDRHTHSHEIGHTLGRPHDVMADGEGVCGEGARAGTPVYPLFQAVPSPGGPIKPALGPMASGDNALIYGLDTLTMATTTKMNPVVDPNVYFDLMSYCDKPPLDVWSSTFTYAALRSSISNLVAPPPAPPVAGPMRSWFFVRGYVDYSTGLAGLLPAWSTATTSTNTPPGSPPGSYLVQVFDALNNLLAQIPFAPDSFEVEEDGIPGLEDGEFLVPVPLMPGMSQVQIMNTSNSQVIATMTASTNLPAITAVSLTDTNGGAFTGAGPLVVHWASQDADPNAQLLYSVQYSSDGGTNWENLDLDLPGSSYQIDSLYLPASLHALIRVLASDGFNTSASVNSPLFVVPNHPPVVAINSPGNGSLFTVDQQIFFDASATDPQDGPLDGANVQWSSSVNGFLGTGALLPCSATNLDEGSHIITVTATDNEGLSASASALIFVLRQPPPVLCIQAASNQLQLSWLASITNFALWSSADLRAGPWTPVTTPPVAADSTQTVSVPATNAPQFFQLRMK